MLVLAGCPQAELEPIVGFIKGILGIFQILIPIGLILFGTIDLGRAVISGDEKQIKEHQNRLLKRALSALLVFLVATIVIFAMAFVGGKEWKECWTGADTCKKGVDPITGECYK